MVQQQQLTTTMTTTTNSKVVVGGVRSSSTPHRLFSFMSHSFMFGLISILPLILSLWTTTTISPLLLATASTTSPAATGTADVADGILDDGKLGDAGEHKDEDPVQVVEDLKSMLGMEPAEMKRRSDMVFDFMDTNKNGILDDEEIRVWMAKIKEAVQKKQVVVEMESIDKNGDKKVTFEEMQAAYADADGGNVNEDTLTELRKRFHTVDKNHDGALSLDEIGLLMNPGQDDELMKLEIDEILNAQDKDKDRRISFDEFMNAEENASPEDAEQFKSEFDSYDLNKDGFIDEEEIRQVVAEPHQQEITESAKELRKLAADGELTKAYWSDKFHKFVISAATDNGELLRYPKEYELGLPFEDLPKSTHENGDDDMMDREEL
eukprot:GHVS01012037.1.p1 GENE.GHVS01012037.1~~GHVS01012037.1.p1  ORF type:complete len:379 (+),score=92.90 GHVS01012037.1:295-1431(+)